ncbi:MAG: hypothetical protein DI587_37585 [Variovorax paradoxus]|nr:MAG: hypothetical protein DI583_37585 [Variovorax paradoxus]PZQ00070.1 MAG: hypothetical protein DI587_37585 [Variovorax paradoxus]
MKRFFFGLTIAALASIASAQGTGFDDTALGAPPAHWHCGVTGGGTPHWVVTTEPGSANPAKVLLQDGRGTYPWCVKDGTAITDGFVETQFKPLAGREDQAGGVVWRWINTDNYFVARANALENNVSLYYVEGGSRKTIKYIDAPVAAASWHTLRVEFSGTHIAVSLDGKRYIDLDDSHITGPGAAGVWTKADSVTAFSHFQAGSSN